MSFYAQLRESLDMLKQAVQDGLISKEDFTKIFYTLIAKLEKATETEDISNIYAALAKILGLTDKNLKFLEWEFAKMSDNLISAYNRTVQKQIVRTTAFEILSRFAVSEKLFAENSDVMVKEDTWLDLVWIIEITDRIREHVQTSTFKSWLVDKLIAAQLVYRSKPETNQLKVVTSMIEVGMSIGLFSDTRPILKNIPEENLIFASVVKASSVI